MTSKKNASIGIVLAAVPGYSETFFVSKIRSLTERGFNVTVLARGVNGGGLRAKVINPWPVPNSILLRFILVGIVVPLTWLRAPMATTRFWRLEKVEGSDVFNRLRLVYINAHILVRRFDWLSFGFATQALNRECVARAIRSRMAVSIRGYDIQVYPLSHPRCYQKLWRYTDQLHSLSMALIQDAMRCGLPPDLRWSVIPPSIDTTRFRMGEKKGWGSPLCFVTVARLHWIKGLSHAIGAMATLRDLGFQFTYHIVGEGESREQLLFEIDQHKLGNFVILEGQQRQEAVAKLLARCDIYIQPSLSEGFCNAVLEAQASGALCLVSKAGGLMENVSDGINGWTAVPGSPEAIVDKLQQILRLHWGALSSIREAARNHVLEKHSLTKGSDSWQEFYSGVEN